MVTTNSLTAMEIKSDEELIEKQQGILSVLKTLLADETMLYISMIGMNLDPLDVMFEDHLDEVDDVMDKITELMRQCSKKMSGRVDERAQKSHLKKVPRVSASERSQIARLIISHRAIIRLLRENILTIDEESEDVDAVDLMIPLLQQHQKMMKALQMY